MRAFPLIFIIYLVFPVSCGEKQDPINNKIVIDYDVFYTQHIKAILDKSCIECHASDKQGADRKGAPLNVNTDTYQSAKDSSKRSNVRIQAGTMPPGKKLLDLDMALYKAWVDQDTKE